MDPDRYLYIDSVINNPVASMQREDIDSYRHHCEDTPFILKFPWQVCVIGKVTQTCHLMKDLNIFKKHIIVTFCCNKTEHVVLLSRTISLA